MRRRPSCASSSRPPATSGAKHSTETGDAGMRAMQIIEWGKPLEARESPDPEPKGGAGGVGGSAVHIAPAAVTGKVIVADIDGQKRAHARQMGAVATIDNTAPDAVKQVMEATGGGAAAAIDFVGSPKTMEFGVNILRKGGKLVMVGLYGGAHPISTVLFPFKMMTIAGSYVGTLEDLRELLAVVQAGKVPPIPIETRPA